MCGIVGYLGSNTEKTLIDNLKKLEYRGYDSAGIAVKTANGFKITKSVGEIKNLEKAVVNDSSAFEGIGHTRWATHGKPNQDNAHPHVSSDGKWVLVHNGIIENYCALKEKLVLKGYVFYSETDTEVIAKLLEYYENANTLETIEKTCQALKGSFALAIMRIDENRIYFAKNKSPLFVACSKENALIVSDVICFKGFSEDYFSLNDGEYGYVGQNEIKFFDKFGEIFLEKEIIDFCGFDNECNYQHYMLKEINETNAVIKNIYEFYSDFVKSEYKIPDVKKINRIKLVGCGTAYHASKMGAKFLEEETGIDCTAYVASEFRYGNPKLDERSLVILISQSGETADTLAALEIAKEKGATTLAVVNIEYSALAKKSDYVLPIKAGVEIAVASTKAFSAQLVVLYILSKIFQANLRDEVPDFLEVQKLYDNFSFGNENDIKSVANILKYNDKVFMIGRGEDYLTALESSLKIKETSYINSDIYYAGELKHGFLALIDDNSYVVVFATDQKVLTQTLCNAEESRARGAKLILFTTFEPEKAVRDGCEFVVIVNDTKSKLQCVQNIVYWQTIAYYTSIDKGINPDKPRNLAKSVTVE